MLHHGSSLPMPPLRVVVIGAGGFVGGAVCRRVAAAGVPVLALTRREVDLLAADAADALAILLRPGDSVVAAAAMAPVKTAAMLRDNMVMTAAMISALSRVEAAHVVNIGSDAIYGDCDHPMIESAVAAPTSLHGAMHLARELMFQAELKAPLATLRPTLIYGAGDPHNGYGPNSFRRKANRGEDIVLFGEGEERRDHVAIDDVAELVWRILAHRSTGALNAATGVVTSFNEVARQVIAFSGREVTLSGSPRRGPMPHNGYRAFDPAATLAAFPDFRYTPLAEGLRLAQQEEFG
ncbi:NAD(P)-dependent oxidoreductase [Magnetospirillum sp. UT-4]|uniref:NAD-dependent epimerase/dehydratase family protein n=1 Tax=Magnetospirillum sp. UT-4 TaxID=2681467 RepID=UPI00137E60C2|nr:NAD-dependent epimerase/dehydratase family protein [Magnetospirillum sp. UT-4]CAA7612106.1 NAD-dependent epimerase/dehydratase [Magnetospirillum sp. UT-4]